ncbi:hypothetical protein [Ktedonospora formicarum]|uniref:Tetratricopeptide repeat protein n=1 Tax=Ktedonospora formicarum TaxID=2778364 RepID=A0A8J3I6X9_9CHLR|nr:hypothetical protein [Ktedonospora formicarum]GHO47167.1 hypothetical protein KSX_53300 [Ktedonospora formicarum]
MAGYEGACFVRLHQPRRALLALHQALSQLDVKALRQQSTLLTDMGIAYAQQGNTQKAYDLASQALSITQQTKSRSVLERVHMICTELQAQKATNAAYDLEQHMSTTLTLMTL